MSLIERATSARKPAIPPPSATFPVYASGTTGQLA
jgi:hypothetical protein